VLQDGNAERAVEGPVDEGQVDRVSRSKACARVNPPDATQCLANPILDRVDTEQPELRYLEARQTDLGRADAAADIKDSLTGLRPERALEKFTEGIVPPPFANVLERERRESVEAANHVSEAGLYQNWYPSRMADTDGRRRTLTSGSQIALAKNQTSCDLDGEMAIVNFDKGVYYGLDPTGARIWTLLREPSTIEELCDTLAAVYDVDRSTLESDVRGFVRDLADQGLVEIT